MQRDLFVFLQDVLSAATEIVEYTSGKSLPDYLADGRTRRAVERCLEIIGEALTNIRRQDESGLAVIPETAQLIGLRNVLIHEYGRVDDILIWEAIQTKMHGLISAVEQELATSGGK